MEYEDIVVGLNYHSVEAQDALEKMDPDYWPIIDFRNNQITGVYSTGEEKVVFVDWWGDYWKRTDCSGRAVMDYDDYFEYELSRLEIDDDDVNRITLEVFEPSAAFCTREDAEPFTKWCKTYSLPDSGENMSLLLKYARYWLSCYHQSRGGLAFAEWRIRTSACPQGF